MNDADERPGGAQADPGVGTLGEETERLLGALAGWARDHGADLSGEAERAAGHLTEALREAGSHAPGGSDCRWCPVCRGAGAVRNLNPEVRTHLLVAATSLVHAAAAALETTVPPRSQPQEGVERIDLDDAEEWGDA